ncbi:hypothetical protein C0Q70_21127 [Pomacea canaliculata]|uniref:Receptor for retinol uptake STRA6 n=1 Tax=Pomacea canaliculata TaxID=400727 RepID=A0A2T7NBP1_POMCA|nr:hypothetical protein C0Q70_21127 [Pomacea canaliculata]
MSSPMDALTRSSRISYACAFGATAFLVYEIVMEQRLIIDTPTHKAVKSFAILSVLVYGMVFFPVFACLALSSAFGFGLGALYVWMLLGVQIFKLTEEVQQALTFFVSQRGRLLMILQSLPNLLCLLYLSVSIPGRSLRALRKDSKDSMDKIKECYAGLHVSKLFRKPKVKKVPLPSSHALSHGGGDDRGVHQGELGLCEHLYCYFIFTYFMFFYNIFVGLVSCLLRITKAIVLGIAFLGRLDNSTLSRKFELFDPGFSAYLGFMHIECAHTHPVVIVFTRLVIHMWETAKERQISESNTCSNADLVLNMNLDDLSVRSSRECSSLLIG